MTGQGRLGDGYAPAKRWLGAYTMSGTDVGATCNTRAPNVLRLPGPGCGMRVAVAMVA
jgi:hypothetical protein